MRRVLLIDDDPADQILAKLALEKSGDDFEVTVCDNLEDGMARIKSEVFDLVLLDLGLPESHGLATLDAVQSCDSGIPIVVLTDLCDRVAETESLERGAQDYLSKADLSVENMGRAIRYAIQRGQLWRKLDSANALLEQKNQRLAELCETAQKFVDNVSHEFRTPLTVIKDYVSLLREGIVGEAPLDEEQCRFLDIVADRADDLNTMVDDMLDVSKLESGLLGGWRQKCRIDDVFLRVRAGLEKKASVKNVALQVDFANDLPEIFCDPEKAGRVVTNLAINAIKFCGEPGEVHVSADHDIEGNEVVVRVRDNGHGIDEQSQQAIFERFQQLEPCARSSCKGFGLGLNIAKDLTDLNFGKMNVKSKIGEGSEFSFTLPVADPVEVATRYLNQNQRRNGTHTAVMTAQIDPACEDNEVVAVDSLLSYVLRGGDLLLPLERGRWLLLACVPELEFQSCADRISQAIADANRNRPQGCYPSIELQVEGCWSNADETLVHQVIEIATIPEVARA